MHLATTSEIEARKVKIEFFTAEEVVSFTDDLNARTKKTEIQWASKGSRGDIMLDDQRILAVTDSVGNKTYSVRMYVPDSPYNVFYNLVAKVGEDGSAHEPMVLRYEVDKDYYPTYRTSDRKDAPFKENLDVYSLNGFIQETLLLVRQLNILRLAKATPQVPVLAAAPPLVQAGAASTPPITMEGTLGLPREGMAAIQ